MMGLPKEIRSASTRASVNRSAESAEASTVRSGQIRCSKRTAVRSMKRPLEVARISAEPVSRTRLARNRWRSAALSPRRRAVATGRLRKVVWHVQSPILFCCLTVRSLKPVCCAGLSEAPAADPTVRIGVFAEVSFTKTRCSISLVEKRRQPIVGSNK